MATSVVAQATVFALRQKIAKIEGRLVEELRPSATDTPFDQRGDAIGNAIVVRFGGLARRQPDILPTGADRLDEALGGGLPKAALTEIHASETRDAGMSAGFVLALASRLADTSAPLLWIGTAEIFAEAGRPCGRRRREKDTPAYVRLESKEQLEKTLGVPLFQEQTMRISIVAGGFKPGEADELRRAMATFKRTGTIGNCKVRLIEGMVERG